MTALTRVFTSHNALYELFLFYRIEGGELFERVIDDDFILTERACAIFMRQICEGIQFMHLQRVLHLDMKVTDFTPLTFIYLLIYLLSCSRRIFYA